MIHTDVLAFGAHHDDAELGAGGTLLKLKDSGLQTGIVSLTRGEMNSRTTPEVIAEEAAEAARLLGVAVNDELDLGDCKIQDNEENRLIIANLIRKYRPRIILAPYPADRHVDHVSCGRIVKKASMLARLRKLKSDYPPHAADVVLFYLLQVRNCVPPTAVVDIEAAYERKMEVVRAYQSQFAQSASEQGVIPVGVGDYLFHIESRDRYYGSLINVKYGEPFVSEEPLGLSGLAQILRPA